MTLRLACAAGVAVALLACAGPATDRRHASGIVNFRQSGCTATVAELDQGRVERLVLRGGDGRLHVEYLDAHFRCDQRVTALAEVAAGRVAILVRPADMSPSTVAKCDCLYDVRFEVTDLAAGSYDVTLHRRWDDRHSPNPPVEIGSARAAVK